MDVDAERQAARDRLFELLKSDNEWTTWTDAATLAQAACEPLAAEVERLQAALRSIVAYCDAAAPSPS